MRPGAVSERVSRLSDTGRDLATVYAQLHELLWTPMHRGERSTVRTPGVSDPTAAAATGGWGAFARDEVREALADLDAATELLHSARGRLQRALRSASEVREERAPVVESHPRTPIDEIRDAVTGGASHD